MAQAIKPALLWTSWTLALLTSFAVFSVRSNVALESFWITVELILSTATFFVIRLKTISSSRKAPTDLKLPWHLFALVCVAMVMPIARFASGRWTQNNPEAYELVAIAVLQNMAFLLGSIGSTRRLQWMSVCVSSFLMLFCLAMTDRSFLMPLTVVYACVGIWWLMSAHWNDVERGFVVQQDVPLVSFRLTTLIVLGIGVIIASWVFVPRNFIVQSLSGFMPTSGGNLYSDAGARNGVGDGDMLVAADQDASTFGPVESDLFLESTEPSLYDMMSESYGESMERKRKSEKAVALQGMADETKKAEHESKKSGREFSTVRRASKVGKKPTAGQPSDAVLYVKGNQPLHLRLESYESFDGVTWSNAISQPSATAYAPKLERHNLKPWIRIAEYSPETHHPVPRVDVVKVINLNSPRIVSPPNLTHLHIDKVDRPDFFIWTADGQIAMGERDHVPQLTILRLASQTPILHRYRHEAATELKQPAFESIANLDEGAWKYHRRVAEAWTVDCKNDWQRVEAITQHLRQAFVVDRQVVLPEECDDAVRHFLENQRGPEYLFATTAAELLRVLGIPARIATGFYANPKRFDANAGQIVVERSDVHVWVEVLRDNSWLCIEPTPGFEPPVEYRTWVQWATQIVSSIIRWIEAKWWFVAMVTMAAIALIAWRRLLAVFIWASVCQLLSQRNIESKVVWTVRFCEGQAWLEGSPRSNRQTVKSWLLHSVFPANHSHELDQDLEIIIQGFQHLCYAPAETAQGWMREHRSQIGSASSRVIRVGVGLAIQRAKSRLEKRFVGVITRFRKWTRLGFMRTSRI